MFHWSVALLDHEFNLGVVFRVERPKESLHFRQNELEIALRLFMFNIGIFEYHNEMCRLLQKLCEFM